MRDNFLKTLPLLLFLLVAPAVPGHADVGFGIPDMVEEKVDELDQKVREFKRKQQNQFPALQPFTIIAGDSGILIEESVISRDSRKIYILTSDKNDSGLDISLIDGSGENEGSSSFITGSISEHLTLNSRTQPVILSRIPGDSTSSQITIFDEDLEGFPITGLLADTYTTLALDDADNIYAAGEAGVRKLDDDLQDTTIWRDTSYRVPEDNLITRGDSIFVTDLSETSSTTPSQLTLQLLALDQSDGSVDWKQRLLDYSATDVSGTSYLTIGSDRLYLLLQESRSADEFDTMFVRNISDGSNINTVTYQDVGGVISDNADPVPTVVKDNADQVFAGDKGGTVFRFNSDGTFQSSIDISDSPTVPWIIDDADSVYISVQADTQGAVFASDKLLSDSAPVFVSTSDTLPVNTRPVWLTDGFLGIVFSGGRFTVNETPLDGNNLENGPWPHRYRDNQATRFRNN